MAKQTESQKVAHRKYYLKTTYGITPEEYEELLEKQNHACALCNNERSGPMRIRLAIDHCHETGRIRGLLCQRCNWAIGQLGDNEEALKNALDYIKE